MRRAIGLLFLVGGVASAEPCQVRVSAGDRSVSDGAVGYKCLPALSADRARLALSEIDPDGTRGYPNLTVAVVPSSDKGDGDIKPLEKLVVLEPRDVDEFAGQITTDVLKRIRPRLDKVNALLAKGGFVAVASLAGVPDVDGQEFTVKAGKGEELSIRYHKSRWIEVRKGDALWGKLRLMQVRKGSADGECVLAPRPASLHLTADETLLLVRVRYSGTAGCGDPSDRWRLVHLAPSPSR